MTEGHAEGLALGVDIGGTKVLGVAVDPRGVVVAETRVPTPKSAADPPERGEVSAAEATRVAAAEVTEAVAQVVGTLRDAPQAGGRSTEAMAVGVGVPGMLDRSGVAVFSPNLQGVAGADLRSLLEASLPCADVAVENDANCAALAELEFGEARGADHALVVTLGTGIGGGVITGGDVLVGGSGFAGEIGHMVVDPSGPLCRCGRHGCWERYASGGGLGRLAREAAYAGQLREVVGIAGGDPESVRGEHVTRAALAGDPGALGVMEQLAWWIALGLSNLCAVLDPERIVIAGGLVEAGEIVLSPVRRAFGELVEGSSARPLATIARAALGERAGAVGAALAARRGGLP